MNFIVLPVTFYANYLYFIGVIVRHGRSGAPKSGAPERRSFFGAGAGSAAPFLSAERERERRSFSCSGAGAGAALFFLRWSGSGSAAPNMRERWSATLHAPSFFWSWMT